jgi:hypothetical protein
VWPPRRQPRLRLMLTRHTDLGAPARRNGINRRCSNDR